MTIKIQRIISAFPSKKIGVIGDIMLDHYIDGSVDRISAEAPVPVISIKSEQFVPGGAANTALNSAALGAKTELVGVIGRDLAAKKVLEILGKNEVICRGVFTDASRRSTEKIRITASGQQLVRIDREDARPINKLLEKRILNYISAKISGWDAVVVSDYAKGVITPNLAVKIGELARKYKKHLVVDAKPVNFEFFKKATIISPNEKEAKEVSGINPQSDKDIRRIGEALRKKTSSAVLLTRGREGMTLFSGGRPVHFPSFAPAVVDGTGAGDTVVAVAGLAISSGANLKQAAFIANCAAGVVVGKPGTASVSLKELSNHAELKNKGAGRT